ncbi:MAG TPA: hypothetical protein VJV05_07220 [Pyrinomonadaceae bacterium]|nr:hypothetical protein [Pyrinomonadaceae bacterium]
MLNGLLAVVSLALTVVSFMMYRSSASTLWLVGVVLFLIATLAFGAIFFSSRVNKGEDIHITE